MTIAIPSAFRGLRWEPTDEQEVVVLFGRLLDYLPRPLTIESARTGFPDCRATDSETGDEICIEFELKASHFFRDHARRQEKCDWIVCWHNDMDPAPESPRVVALDQIIDRMMPNLVLSRTPVTGPQIDAFRLRVSRLSSHHQRVIERLLEFGKTKGLTIDWPETNGACFTVRGPVGDCDNVEYFKVSATGRIGVAFSRWGRVAPAVKADVVTRLNDSVSPQWFTGEGKTGRDIMELLSSDASVEQFVSVWQQLVREAPGSLNRDTG